VAVVQGQIDFGKRGRVVLGVWMVVVMEKLLFSALEFVAVVLCM
jgi:hypothetical protein